MYFVSRSFFFVFVYQLFINIVPPSILDNGQIKKDIIVLKDESIVLTCLLHAIPAPTITWTKDDHPLLFDITSQRLKIDFISFPFLLYQFILAVDL